MSESCLFEFAGLESHRYARIATTGKHRGRIDHRSRELEMGKAAEHLVCADLLMKGYNAFLSDQGLPYDVVIDLGRWLVRVQVKGTAKPKNPMPGLRISDGYFFHVRRAGRGSRRVYGENEFDLYALVALDIYAVAYFARGDLDSQTICLRVPGVTYGPGGKMARRFEDGSVTRAIEAASRPPLFASDLHCAQGETIGLRDV